MKRIALLSSAAIVLVACQDATQPRWVDPPDVPVLDLSNTGVCIPPPAGLVSWWPGDTDASDIQGTNNGVLMGASAGVPGKVAGAFSFDGVDDLVSFGSTAGNFGTSDFTIDFWIKPTSTRFEGVLGKRPICMHASFWDVRWDINQGVVVELDQDSWGTNYNVMFAPKAIDDGDFHHVAIVRQGTAASVYIDGAVDASQTTPGVTNISNSASLIAGKSACTGSGATEFFTGLLDEIEIFNRALSEIEIQAIYNAGSAGKCKIQVDIDIKPGSDPNCFNNDGHGVIPVAILGSATFDVASVDPGTVQLDGLSVRARGKSNKLLAHVEDVNGDGFDDLVVQIEDADGTFSTGSGIARLTGALFDGTAFYGTDDICVVP
jgi:hypothetical protein